MFLSLVSYGVVMDVWDEELQVALAASFQVEVKGEDEDSVSVPTVQQTTEEEPSPEQVSDTVRFLFSCR